MLAHDPQLRLGVDITGTDALHSPAATQLGALGDSQAVTRSVERGKLLGPTVPGPAEPGYDAAHPAAGIGRASLPGSRRVLHRHHRVRGERGNGA